MNNDLQSLPTALKNSVATKIRNSMEIAWPSLLLKIVFSYSAAAVGTLWFCPQYGVLLGPTDRVMHFYHSLVGPDLCFLLCGATFAGAGALVAHFFLSYDERIAVRRHSVLFSFSFSIVAAISLSVISETLAITPLTEHALWISGASLASYALFRARTKFSLI